MEELIDDARMLDAEAVLKDVEARDEVFTALDDYAKATTMPDAIEAAIAASIALDASDDSDEDKAAARRLISQALCGGGHVLTDEWRK